MTPAEMADLHAAAFKPARGWSESEFKALCGSPHVKIHSESGGFSLVRVVAEEAELLTLAVDPNLRRRGIADRLMRSWMDQTNAEKAFLEVADDNFAALALYRKHGFSVSGRRRAYYQRTNGPAVDAIVMQAALTGGQSAESLT